MKAGGGFILGGGMCVEWIGSLCGRVVVEVCDERMKGG